MSVGFYESLRAPKLSIGCAWDVGVVPVATHYGNQVVRDGRQALQGPMPAIYIRNINALYKEPSQEAQQKHTQLHEHLMKFTRMRPLRHQKIPDVRIMSQPHLSPG